MNKYIDTDSLRKEIGHRIDILEDMSIKCAKNDDAEMHAYYHGKAVSLQELLYFIDSLQQEQPEVDLEEAVFKEWGTTKEKYLAKSMDKVHLEMEIATYLQDWDDDDEIGLHLSTDNGSIPIELEDIRDLACHFAEWGAEHLKR